MSCLSGKKRIESNGYIFLLIRGSLAHQIEYCSERHDILCPFTYPWNNYEQKKDRPWRCHAHKRNEKKLHLLVLICFHPTETDFFILSICQLRVHFSPVARS
jgi:hypothetical protein